MSRSLLSKLGPGLLVAATGVGAGDLITASLAGRELGLVILWAAPLGAVIKWVLNEGLARWQMATGTTLLEGWLQRLGRWVDWFFLPYLLLWSVAVGAALIKACGLAASALAPTWARSELLWGVAHSLAGLALVWRGGFKLFERAMAVCVGLMFCTVLTTVAVGAPDLGDLVGGLFWPRIPEDGLAWTLGVLGGVGGTVTLMSYGYWIREEQREGPQGLVESRLDLAVGYAVTAVFGISMIIIGSALVVEGKGASVALALADRLGDSLGPAGRMVFLLGFWAAVTSSLLGVWQGVPYLFADYWRLRRRQSLAGDLTATPAYRCYLVGLALVPLAFQTLSLRAVQLSYAVLGALFMPFLALTLLIMNNRADWVGQGFRNGPLINLILVATLLFFGCQGYEEVLQAWAGN